MIYAYQLHHSQYDQFTLGSQHMVNAHVYQTYMPRPIRTHSTDRRAQILANTDSISAIQVGSVVVSCRVIELFRLCH